MLNIDPLLFQPKVIRMSTTSNIGLPGQHIIRTTEYSNSQIMTGTAAQIHNEANNNILTTNTIDTAGEFASRGREFGNISQSRDFRNFNEMELNDEMDPERISTSQQAEWGAEMCWSGEGDGSDNSILERLVQQNSASIMSFQSNLSNSTASTSFHSQLSEQSESSKEEIIQSMLEKVRSQNKVEASKILLAMSNSVENCLAMRQCGVLPLLIQLLHSPDDSNSNTYHLAHAKRVNFEIRERASQVLHNIVFSQPDDKRGRREARVLRLLEQIRDYCDQLRNLDESTDVDDNRNSRCVDQHIGPTVAALMKLSFDEDHRHAMCQLGGLQAIAELLQIDNEVHGCTSDQYCITIRRYSGMALTNLTFGDGANKALLCSMRSFMEALVAQLYSPSEDLRQVTASVLRNLSWRADPVCKRILRETGAVTILVKAAMDAEKESTLKSILSALWNLSAHCSANKADICLVDGALAFLVSTLTYKSKSKTLAIVENGGGILRNVSSHIAIQNEYRAILRKHNCLQILLQHLKSPSLTVVSNACGTLWNLSARNAADQRALWEMGAVGMLKKLINSKHKMISMGSSAALKNLLSAKPPGVTMGLCVHNDGYKGSTEVPSLHIRKEKALSQEIDQNLSETYDNTDSPKTSPSHHAINEKNNRARRHISPSARYMTTQKQRQDLLSMQNRGGIKDEKLTYVVEEKHNGAFQVTKNAKQALNYQGQGRLQPEFKGELQESEIPRFAAERNSVPNYESLNRKVKQEAYAPKQPITPQSKSDSVPRCPNNNTPPQISVKKDYKGSDRITNAAQKAKTVCRDPRDHVPDSTLKQTAESSGIPKPVHESRIPLPKSCGKVDAQRSQSASPIVQRRAMSQRQEITQPVTSRNVDVTETYPKYAWCDESEKEDTEPEQTVRFSRSTIKQELAITEHPKVFETFHPQDDYSYGSEDEIKVYNTENTPLNYSLNASMTNLEETGATARCSLNIKTCTNVKLMNNHALLSNVGNRTEDNSAKLFEYRHGTNNYRNFEGKTIDFSVQSDYDIDENLSMMSRSSSVASLSSFDQQSFHDDESFASDLSHHTSGIESPSELSDSPCQTVPSSPQKTKDSPHVSSNLSDAFQTKLPAAEDEAEVICDLKHVNNEKEPGTDLKEASCSPTANADMSQIEVRKRSTVSKENTTLPTSTMHTEEILSENRSIIGENDIDELAAKLANDNYPTSTANACKNGDSQKSKVQSEEQSISDVTESTDFVTCVSELGSSSSAEMGSMEDISPIERVMLEKCIRAGLPQRSMDKSQGAKQKIPQLSYQLLKDTVEKHPKACSFESDRSISLKTLDLKENEYESHSENEEKGKEDERKAEKKRLFRIPESPVDKKVYGSTDSNKNEYSLHETAELKSNEQSNLYSMKVVVDQKGNRRCEKYADKVKVKQKHPEPSQSQLDFLITNRKGISSSDLNTDKVVDNKCSINLENQNIQTENENIDAKMQNMCEVNDQIESNTDSKIEGNVNTNLVKDSTRILSKVKVVDTSNDHECEKNDKDPETCEKENSGDSEESMISSSLLCEAREIAETLLGERIGSTEDMTVSTLSCLSDIDSARPPSVLGEMGSLSMTNSVASEENLKVAVTKECQKLFGKAYNKQTTSKKSLLRELQTSRFNNEHNSNDISKGSNGSPDNLSLKSNSASELLGNINPPSILDELSLTASTGSLDGSERNDSECDSEKVLDPYPSKQDSMSERMNDAAAMAQLYAKELSNITGNCLKESPSNDAISRMKTQSGVQEVMEVTIADVTEIGCDTIGSDTELEDDLPCDDEDLGSETLQAPFQNTLSKDDQGDGSTENLTLTLTEEPNKSDTEEPNRSAYFEFSKNNEFFMTAEELKALQENADMILNTLRDAEISDDEDEEDHCGMSNGDMLEDETMSLVSNESDEEFLSPDGTMPSHIQKQSPKGVTSPTCNGMVALPLGTYNGPPKYALKKTSLPQISAKCRPNGIAKVDDLNSKYGYSYPESAKQELPSNVPHFSESPKKNVLPTKVNQINDNSVSKIKPPTSNKKSLSSAAAESYLTQEQTREEDNSVFDSRTFTRKKSTVPKGMIPSIQTGPIPQFGSAQSPSSHDIPSLPGSIENTVIRTSESPKVITSRIASAWKSGKVRSKSMVDPNRNSKFKLEKASSIGNNLPRDGANHNERSPSQTPSPQSPLRRSSTYEKLNEDERTASSSNRRPNSLVLQQKLSSPRHMKAPSATQRPHRQTGEGATRSRTIPPKTDLQSPTLHQNLSNIPKFQNKAQASLIPSRRSMIPTPAKFDFPDN